VASRRAKSPFDPKLFLSKINGGRTIPEYNKNKIVYAQGAPADAVFYIESGKAKITVVSKQGKEAVVAILGAGDFFGEGSLAGQVLLAPSKKKRPPVEAAPSLRCYAASSGVDARGRSDTATVFTWPQFAHRKFRSSISARVGCGSHNSRLIALPQVRHVSNAWLSLSMCLFLSPDLFRAETTTLRWVPMSEGGLDALMWRLNRIKGALIRQMRLSNIDRAATNKLRQRLERGVRENCH
jgi:hypothetical protein